MRTPVLLAALSVWLLTPGGASSQVAYELLEGTFSTEDTEGAARLSGGFAGVPGVAILDPAESPADPMPDVLLVVDFAFAAGDRTLEPRGEIEFEGLRPILIPLIADQIGVSLTRPTLTRLHGGGDLVDVTGDEVTFRTLELRGEGLNEVAGELPGSGLPRRIAVAGKLVEVDVTYQVRREDCDPIIILPPSAPTPPGGGVIISVPVDPVLPGLEVALPNAPALTLAGVPVPTPDELGVSGPEDILVTLDGDGVLSIESSGDLLVDWVAPETPGLTRVVIRSSGRIEVTSIELPPGVALELFAEIVDIPGDVDVPGDVVVRPPANIFCPALRRTGPDEVREVGSFSFVATAATPVAIDVRPWNARNRVDPDRPGLLPVALLGSEALDVRDVSERSLRLGRGEAEPLGRRRPRVWRGDANGDGRVDLLAFFRGRDAEVAYGDPRLCLTAETRDGALLEGCDAIRALPRWAGRRVR
jgi:hypothetical protein